MSKNFFEKPFDEDTLVKLEMYGDYVRKWAPVFLAREKPFVYTINIFDFFSGVGCDSEGTHGSPMLTVNILMEFAEFLKREELSINIYLNDYNTKYCERLKQNIDNLNFDRDNINIEILNKDFKVAFDKLRPKMDNAANLIFLDQFGIKYITRKFFEKLIKIPVTDILFFISSAIYKRFSKDKNINKVIGINPKIVEKTPGTHIHKLVCERYNSFIPQDYNYGIAPFSIKKGANVYGLIFGSGHLLGMEKFLEVCWNKDRLTGEANFDIQGENINEVTPFLFQEMNKSSKIDLFQKELKDKILNREITNDLEIYLFMINSGFLGQHVRPIIQALKKDKIIILKQPSFKYSTVSDRNRKPKEIVIC